MTPSHSLPSELTIYTVGELRPQWLTWLTAVRDGAAAEHAHDAAFVVDAAAVSEVDAAGVQLLLSLGKALRGEHRVLQLCAASGALAQACGVLGAQALLAETTTTGATT